MDMRRRRKKRMRSCCDLTLTLSKERELKEILLFIGPCPSPLERG
jgi:hypothetical protein